LKAITAYGLVITGIISVGVWPLILRLRGQ
jgi:hypothetical protein